MTCRVCRHGRRLEIEKALLGGAPHRSVAKRFGATPSAVFRHLKGHLGPRLARAQAAQDAATDRAARFEVARESWSAESLMRKILSLGEEAETILAEAKRGKDHDLALRAIGRAAGLLELQGKAIASVQSASSACPRCSAVPKDPEELRRSINHYIARLYASQPREFLESVRRVAAEQYAHGRMAVDDARAVFAALEAGKSRSEALEIVKPRHEAGPTAARNL